MKGRQWDLVEVNREVAAYVDDVSNIRWTSAEVDRAIQNAVRGASHVWFEERIDDTLTYAVATQRYALPPICEELLEVWFAPTTASQPYKFVPMSAWRVEGIQLVMQHVFNAYAGKTMYLYYTVRPTSLLAIGAADLATNGTTTVTSATSTWVVHGVKGGDSLEITSGADIGIYYVASVTNDTTIVLHKAPAATAGGISFTVAQFTDLPFDYLVHYAMAWLYGLAARNRPGIVVADAVQWANYYRQLADLDLSRNARSPRPVKRYG